MTCPSVVGLWPATPPSHRITSVLSIANDPPSIYTGGSDGSVIWWRLNFMDSTPSIWPMALLCGHANSISALSTADADALVSACADGVLCVWNRSSGLCRRRRRLPPWAGSASKLSLLSSSPRYLIATCSCVDSSSHESVNKWAVLVLDSRLLTVLRTIFHGSLDIGPVKSMIATHSEEDGKEFVILVDGHGKTQLINVQNESDHNGHELLNNASVSIEELNDGLMVIAVEAEWNLIAMVSEFICEFKSIDNGVSLGEISLTNSPLCSGESFVNPIGCIFLKSDTSVHSFKRICFWSSSGAALVYKVNRKGDGLECECMCEIPAMADSVNEKVVVSFCELKDYLVRIESTCYMVGDSQLYRPYFTLWTLGPCELKTGRSSEDCLTSSLSGHGGFPTYPIGKLSLCSSVEAHEGSKENTKDLEFLKGHEPNDCTVSSSIILPEEFFAPYAIVYGFYNGDIEVIKFLNGILKLDLINGNIRQHNEPQTGRNTLSGHTAPILCLAAHHLEERSFCRALISGCSDCTVRIWDLDSGSLLVVMHHHVSPVRQIIMPPPCTDKPWKHCFLSVGEDGCVALVSLETLRVERMFPGHPSYPSVVAWDSLRGYIACLCGNTSSSDGLGVLYLWDVKTGTRERIIRGTASHSMFDNFCRGININSLNGSILGGVTSLSSLLLPILEDINISQTHHTKMSAAGRSHRGVNVSEYSSSLANVKGLAFSKPHNLTHDVPKNCSTRQAAAQLLHQGHQYPIQSSCPFPGIAYMNFDLSSILSTHFTQKNDTEVSRPRRDYHSNETIQKQEKPNDGANVYETKNHTVKGLFEEDLLRFSLSFLHLWDVDQELDRLLIKEMNFSKPEGFYLSSGLLGDRGSVTVMFSGLHATLELWRSSSEFSAMRSLTMVSLAQRMISISHASTAASSALAAFYARNFAEKVPDIKPPLLQLLVSFWQDASEHVRMAARSLFHCAAPRAIPHSLCNEKAVLPDAPSSPVHVIIPPNIDDASVDRHVGSCASNGSNMVDDGDSEISTWLDSYGVDDWISYIGGTTQDAMASHIIAAAALAVWYPSIIKSNIPKLVVNQLIKLVMSMNDRYSSTAAEILAEGMDTSWKACLANEIPQLIGDIFFQVECLSSSPATSSIQKPAVAVTIREALIGMLLPSLAMADILSFLNVIEGQIWATSSDSPVHLVALKTIIRAACGSPKPMAQHLDKVVKYILQTMDHGNLVLRKACFSTSMITLKEIARVFPMVALNEPCTRLAVGDAIGDIHNVTIRVYDLESITQMKVLDASGPPGLPSLIEETSPTKISTAITALSFSPDGEGLIAFSENGLMIRWWSLGTAWWEKLSRSLVPVQCTKLILVPPWEGFSPNSSRLSIMASIGGHDKQEKSIDLEDADSLKNVIHNLDLSYRLKWIDAKKVVLIHHGQELGVFQL